MKKIKDMVEDELIKLVAQVCDRTTKLNKDIDDFLVIAKKLKEDK